jgi:hypothetical protein
MAANGIAPLIVLTTQLPRPGSESDRALRAAGPGGIYDAIDLVSEAGRARLAVYAGGHTAAPVPGFWHEADLAPGAV